MSTLPTTSYALLGLLDVAPMSGYDLAQATEKSIANFWPVSRSQVYSELARLERMGLIRGTEVAQERLPDKRVFEVTEDGLRELEAWADSPGFEPDRYRSEFLVKMFFGHKMSRETMIKNLESFRAEAEHDADYLRNAVAKMEMLPQAAYARSTAMLGLRITEAAIAWADELIRDLPQIPHPETEEDHEHIHRVARALFEKVSQRDA
jgi:PadR family transcriptional regulator, regulatory protein AphA